MRHLKKFENNKELDIEYDIAEIIQGELFLRQVPYSMLDNQMEVDPASVEEAAKEQ